MSWMKRAVSCAPSDALTSQRKPPAVNLRTPPTTDMSCASPPKLGVKPPGNRSRNEKQFGSSNTCCRATESATLSVMVTVGQFADPMPLAISTSPISSVWPPSRLKTPPRVFGFRKKKPPVTRLLAYKRRRLGAREQKKGSGSEICRDIPRYAGI